MWLPSPVSKMALEFCKCGLGHERGLNNVCKVSAAHLGRCHTLAEAVCGSKVLIQLSKELCKQQAQPLLVAAVKWELSGPQFLTNWT